jgi:hypothetical protein
MKTLESDWLNVIIFAAAALVLVIFTRGTLGYQGNQSDD